MKNKKYRLLISIFLVCIVFVTSIPSVAQATAANQATTPKNVQNDTPKPLIDINNAYFKAFDKETKTEITDFKQIPKDAYIEIGYSFQLLDLYDEYGEDGSVLSDDYFTISLPSELTSIAEFSQVTGETLQTTKDGETYDIATMNISNDKGITITFLKAVEELSEIELKFSLGGFLQPDKIDDDDDISFSLLANGTVYSIGFISQTPEIPEVNASILKEGKYDEDKNEIVWKVTVDPGNSKDTIEQTIVKDIMGDDQTYILGSTEPATYEPTKDGSENTYAFNLSDISDKTSFTYRTTPTDSGFSTTEGGQNIVTNTAELYYQGDLDKKATINATVPIITNWIEKSGAVRAENGVNYIDWSIELNENHRTIPKNATITDTVPKYLTIETDSVKRNGVSPASLGDDISINGQSLTYKFGENASEKQTVTFTTKVDQAYYQQQSVSEFTNTAAISIEGVAYSDTSDGVKVPTKLLTKSGAGYDPSTQRITWKMKVNENGQIISNARITDQLDNNQLFYEDYGIQTEDGKTLQRVDDIANLSDVAYQYYEENGQISIFLGNLGEDDRPALYYKTTVTNQIDCANNKYTDYKNTAVLTGDEITESSSTGTQTVSSQVLSKENVGYNYNSRILSWKMTVNQNNMPLSNAVITDTIPKEQTYVADSLLIDGKKPNAGQVTEENNVLTIQLGQINLQSVVTYETKVADLDTFMDHNEDITFNNEAILDTGITGATKIKVQAAKVVKNKALSKKLLTEYVKENGYIEWEVYVNSNQAPIKNAILDDKLQDGLELNADSVTLQYWNQDKDGNLTIQDAVSKDDYHFTYDYDTREFKLYLPDGSQGYYLKFKTDVVKPGKYSNSISLGGNYQGSDGQASSYFISNSDLAASASGTNGSITVIKTDKDGTAITTGAEFELLDSRYNVKKVLTTDKNGTLEFDKLKFRTYYIREKTAPAGYAIDNQAYEIALSKASPETANQTIKVVNHVLTGTIHLKKTNKNKEGLAGATFSIYNESDTQYNNPLATVISEEGGDITFKGLEEGTYIIKEVKAPAGYQITNEVQKATLKIDESTNTIADAIIQEPFINEALPSVKFGTAQVRKTDESGNPLLGAEFGIYDENQDLLQSIKSKENGEVLFSNIPFGTYTIKEIKAPEGYQITSESATVTIKDSDKETQAVPYRIVNKKTESSGSTTDNDDTDTKVDNDSEDGKTDSKTDSNAESKQKKVKKENIKLNDDSNTDSNQQQKTTNLNKLFQAGSFFDGAVIVGIGAILIIIGFALRWKKVHKKE